MIRKQMENTAIQLSALSAPRTRVLSRFFSHACGWISPFFRRHSAIMTAIGLPLIFYNAFVLPYIGFVPVWDSNEYVQCIMRPWISDGHNILQSVFCFGHPSGLYIAFLRLMQMPDPGNIALINAANFGLGNLSVLAFFLIVRAIFPKASLLQASLMTLAYATHPVLLANTVNFTLDTGILFFFIYTFALLLYRQYSWVALVGLFFVFTKEVGAPIYFLLVASYIFFFVMRSEQTLREKMSELLKCAEMAIPLIFFALFYFYQTMIEHQSMTWGGFGMAQKTLPLLMSFNFLDLRFLIALADLFVLNFLWVSTCVTAAAFLVIGSRSAFRLPSVVDGDRSAIAMLVCSTVLVSFFVIRIWPLALFNNVRYIIMLYPLSLLLFFVGCRYLFRREALRAIVLLVVVALNMSAIFRSDDPLSARIYGTHAYGGQRIFTIGAPLHECCELGRDQLVYNLQFAAFAGVSDAAYKLIKPTKDTIIAVSGNAGNGYVTDRIDQTTHKRTFSDSGVRPHYTSPNNIINSQNLSLDFYYITYPFLIPNNDLERLSQLYDVAQEWNVETSGAETATLFKFVPKPQPTKVASL